MRDHEESMHLEEISSSFTLHATAIRAASSDMEVRRPFDIFAGVGAPRNTCNFLG